MSLARVVSAAVLAACLGHGAGCGTEDEPPPAPEPPVEELPDGNPIDRAMAPVFAAHGIAPVEAGPAELCRRLSADLLGVYPTAAEAEAACAGRTADAVVRDFQARPEYLLVTDRRWRDRLETTDLFVNWRDVAHLYELIHRAHTHGLRYDALAAAVISHPAFTLQHDTAGERARAAFLAFLGRAPTAFEQSSFGSLLQTWHLGGAAPDEVFPYFERYHAFVPTDACYHAARCTTPLFGGGRMDMRGWEFAMPRWADIDPDLAHILGEPGRLLTGTLAFWDAAADELLSRYLGWSDGGRTPREPGAVLPEVRQALADYLRISGDYADAERMVLTSWLYRQSAVAGATHAGPGSAGAPVFAAGPVKPALPEVWLASLARHTRALGGDEPRFPDHWYWMEIWNAHVRGAISRQRYTDDVLALHAMQGNRLGLFHVADGLLVPQLEFRDRARSLGGAPSLGRVRQAPEGLAFAWTQDAIAAALCADAPPVTAAEGLSGGAALAAIVDALVPRFYGRAATADDRAAFEAAYAACTGEACEPAALGAAVCRALATAPEMHFY